MTLCTLCGEEIGPLEASEVCRGGLAHYLCVEDWLGEDLTQDDEEDEEGDA